PTPTNTPTPTPSQPKKVVVIPGMPGSWNKDALLHCKTSGYSGGWTSWDFANANVYAPLITGLEQAGYQPLPFYYDWRKQVTATVPLLSSFIQNSIQSGETVDLVGHSFGGLVSRAYLESAQTNSHLEKLLAIGSPHKGSVIAYPAWSGGEMWIEDSKMRLAFTLMQAMCRARFRWSARETVNNAIPSVQNILPIFDYLKNPNGTMKPISTMTAKNNWLPTSFDPPYYGVTVGTLTGKGFDTLNTLDVRPPNRADQRLGNWPDGKPTQNRTYADGDGTVLAESAQLPGAENLSPLPLGHTALVTDPQGIQAIIDFLNGGESVQPLSLLKQAEKLITPAKGAAILLVIVDGAQATLTDKNGNTYEDSEGQITILNPHKEAYTLAVTSEKRWWWKTKYKVIVVQLFEDGTYTWKEYDRYDLLKKRFKLRFDSKRRGEDIMHDK
ncbi:MAG: hypothetical protein AAB960_01110, partial [Patescibacteria group bacterium]